MTGAALLGMLGLLALVDSTSFGTLLVPVWLLMGPGRSRAGRVLTYLAAVAMTYFLVGLLLLVGARTLVPVLTGILDSTPFLVVQLLVGVGLLILSARMDTPRSRARAASGEGRIPRWRTRVGGVANAGSGSFVALALAAVGAETASTFPYLAAIGLLVGQGVPWSTSAFLLVGYCLAMILPALVLLVGRTVAHDALDAPLLRLDRWLTVHVSATTAWVVGIAGALGALHAMTGLT